MSKFAHVINQDLRNILEREDPHTLTHVELARAVQYSRNMTANDADDMRLSEATYWARLAAMRKAERNLKFNNVSEVHAALKDLWG